jgi:UPF0271 protein
VLTIDLNADLGEGGAYDLELLSVVSSCNIACGGHAGNAATMLATVRQALANDVAIGAHPGYPDVPGFGRRRAFLVGDELKKSIINQIDALLRIATEAGGRLSHIKAHGGLYADAAADRNMAQSFVTACKQAAPLCNIVGPPNSALQAAAVDAGLDFVVEAFVDRTYLPDGTLLPRSEAGAVHANLNTITAQAVSLASKQQLTAQDGSVINVRADTLCIHGDTANADIAARAVRDVLRANGIQVRAAS